MNIGILAVQGAFTEHKKILEKLGVASFEIRQKSDLDRQTDGIIIPGGESTVMGKLTEELGMKEILLGYIKSGIPIFGTCAGMILLADKIEGEEKAHLASMDITVVRNAYGRQLGSFETVSEFAGRPVKMVFIRAPYVSRTGENVKILSTVDGKIAAVRQGNMLATAFHPELTDDASVHEYFIGMIRDFSNNK
ncbi:MAG: pyridoxal 5'-phosphate synthase glutaminase subunit PdxT [Eubacteriales bacterium]|nr:pyridoxal 5'-phosphate synthase glutaminase subunit PdxT [Eubacteriales bacterium]